MMTTSSVTASAGVTLASSSAAASSTPRTAAASSASAGAVARVSADHFRGEYYKRLNRELFLSRPPDVSCSLPTRCTRQISLPTSHEPIKNWNGRYRSVVEAMNEKCPSFQGLEQYLQEWLNIFDQIKNQLDQNSAAEVYEGVGKFFDLLTKIQSHMGKNTLVIDQGRIIDMIVTLSNLSGDDTARLNAILDGCVFLLFLNNELQYGENIKEFKTALLSALTHESVLLEMFEQMDDYRVERNAISLCRTHKPLVWKIQDIEMTLVRQSNKRLIALNDSRIAHRCLNGVNPSCDECKQSFCLKLRHLQVFMHQKTFFAFEKWQKLVQECEELVSAFKTVEQKTCQWFLSVCMNLRNVVEHFDCYTEEEYSQRIREAYDVAHVSVTIEESNGIIKTLVDVGQDILREIIMFLEEGQSRSELAVLMKKMSDIKLKGVREGLKEKMNAVLKLIQEANNLDGRESQNNQLACRLRELDDKLDTENDNLNQKEKKVKEWVRGCLYELMTIIMRDNYVAKICSAYSRSLVSEATDLNDVD